jgi:hypothetical protein
MNSAGDVGVLDTFGSEVSGGSQALTPVLIRCTSWISGGA